MGGRSAIEGGRLAGKEVQEVITFMVTLIMGNLLGIVPTEENESLITVVWFGEVLVELYVGLAILEDWI